MSTNTASMMGQQQLNEIVTPHDHDVLSGRGNFVNYHAGNEHFRSLVRKHKVAYVACPKQQKGKFSRLIVEEIRARNPPGRFLKQDPVTKLWYDIGEKKALDKTRQALREGAPEIMKEMSGDEEVPTAGDNGEAGSSKAKLPRSPKEESGTPRSNPSNSLGNDISLASGSNHGEMANNGRQRQNEGIVYASTGHMNMGMPGQDPSSVFHPQQAGSMPMANNMMGRGSQHGGLSHSQHGAMNNNSGLSHSQHNPHSNNIRNMDMQQQHYIQGQQIMQQGLGSLADLRARMQQQQQRQFPVFNTGNNNHQSMPNPDQGMQNKLQNLTQLQQSMFAQNLPQQSMNGATGTFEFEPRPIAPGNEAAMMPPSAISSMGQTNEAAPSLGGPHKATSKNNNLERQGSDKSLEMGSVFDKAIHGGPSTQVTKEKMGNSAGSGMSISLGDINLDDDDDDSDTNNHAKMAPPAPKSSQTPAQATSSTDNPDELASMFNSSMNFKQQKQQQHAGSTDKSFEMSVNTLGDSGNLFNSNASMNFSEASFGDVFDDGEKDMLAAS